MVALRFPTKAMSRGPADSSDAAPATSTLPSPSHGAFKCFAISSTRITPVSYKLMPVDPSAWVASTARIHPEARIGPQVKIDEFAIVEEDVVIGAHCRLEPYVYVKRWTTL